MTGMCCRYLPLLVGLVALVRGAVPAAAGDLVLAPGEPLGATHLERLLTARLPPTAEDERWRVAGTEPPLPLANAATAPVTIRLDRVELAPTAGRFGASLAVISGPSVLGRVEMAGTLVRERALPVLTHPVGKGEVVRSGDLEMRWLPGDQVHADHVVAVDDVLGREAQRILLPGRALRERDLAPARAVVRGALVTLVYTRGALEITTAGRALDDGALGDPVQAVNVASNERVLGFASAPGEVRVGDGRR